VNDDPSYDQEMWLGADMKDPRNKSALCYPNHEKVLLREDFTDKQPDHLHFMLH